jgi:NOL1/NOP2/fmu family ribosome biogenesis protein
VPKETWNLWREFADAVFPEEAAETVGYPESVPGICGRLITFGEHLYLLPPDMTDMKGLKVIRPGLELGTFKKNRFEPAHALALYLNRHQVKQWVSMPGDSAPARNFLRGETIEINGLSDQDASWEISGNGWVLMLVDGISIGWAKLVGSILKNHYPKGLRRP